MANQVAGGINRPVSTLQDVCPEWERCEAELIGSGVAVPLTHRTIWARTLSQPKFWYLAVKNNSGSYCGGMTVEVARSRALPFHVLLRVQRCTPSRADVQEQLFTALAELARRNGRVLRVNVELFSAEKELRSNAGKTLTALGFRPARSPRGYANTISVDLSPTEETIFSRFSQTGRRHVRAIDKIGWIIKPITDEVLIPRMQSMLQATMERTGGVFIHRDWEPVIKFCRENPNLARLVGLFRNDIAGPDALVAFAWGLHHMDHAEYNTAATIKVDEIKVPLAYGLVWDLICWAKRNGANWFDLGGVTPGQQGDANDRLGGISDFKRYFSKTIANVGEDWEYEPHPSRAKLARLISASLHKFSGR